MWFFAFLSKAFVTAYYYFLNLQGVTCFYSVSSSKLEYLLPSCLHTNLFSSLFSVDILLTISLKKHWEWFFFLFQRRKTSAKIINLNPRSIKQKCESFLNININGLSLYRKGRQFFLRRFSQFSLTPHSYSRYMLSILFSKSNPSLSSGFTHLFSVLSSSLMFVGNFQMSGCKYVPISY